MNKYQETCVEIIGLLRTGEMSEFEVEHEWPSTNVYSPNSRMGTCASCCYRPSDFECDSAEYCDPNYALLPNSVSYPLFSDEYNGQMPYDPRFTFGSQEYLHSYSSIPKTYSTLSMTSSVSPNFQDCRLRYIRQTRRLQKFLRITPEGRLIVNDVLKKGCQNCQEPSRLQGNGNSGMKSNSVSTLISSPKLRRIYAAFWSLQPRNHDYQAAGDGEVRQSAYSTLSKCEERDEEDVEAIETATCSPESNTPHSDDHTTR